MKSVSKSKSALDESKQVYRGNKYNQQEYIREESGRLKNKIIARNNLSGQDSLLSKKVWEPAEAQRNYPRSNSDTDITLRSSSYNEGAGADHNFVKSPALLQQMRTVMLKLRDKCSSLDATSKEVGVCAYRNPILNGISHSTMSSTSSSDNRSSCLSEGDSNTSSSNYGNLESHHQILKRSVNNQTGKILQSPFKMVSLSIRSKGLIAYSMQMEGLLWKASHCLDTHLMVEASFAQSPDGGGNKVPGNPPTTVEIPDNEKSTAIMGSQHQGMFPSVRNQPVQFPVYQAPSTMSYYHNNPVPWSATPANGLMSFPPPNPYIYTDPIGYGKWELRFMHVVWHPAAFW
ncbi:Detected protein of unknown function [Hibiscus syriacus]|uniref:Uncharacterized protein n=1 Tax=Hibiscus syriacus TaxID=106335 RepID=A0A6A3AFL9_HIBSY|nr:Detected protein of unknown function [Hibiscus syriacus]